MFDSLRKKFSSWLSDGKNKEEAKKEEKKTEKEEGKKSKKIEKKRVEKKSKKGGKLKEEKEEGKNKGLDEKPKDKLKKVEKEELVIVDDVIIEEKLRDEADRIKEEIHFERSIGDQLVWEGVGESMVDKMKGEESIEELGGEIKEEIEEKRGFFGKLIQRISTSELKKEEFNEIFEEFEFELLENNVALEVVDKIKELLAGKLVGKKFKKREAEKEILKVLGESIEKILVEGGDFVESIKKKKDKPFVILFFGINGAGKTTSIAKIAWKLKKEGLKCVLAAGDTFRAASIEQLEYHAKKNNVPLIKQDYKADPSAVAFDAIAYAKKNKSDVVLIDTAGRMYTKTNLMREMEKIVRVSKPDMKIFVGESITGNDATEQAKMFNESCGIDGIILSKADIDEKAGAILSVGYVTGKPILFLGVGQGYEDLKEFKKKDVLYGLGLGDSSL